MKHIKSFNESNESIDSICKRYCIYDYTINPDGSIDVDGNVGLHRNRLRTIPLKFGKVSGDFYCENNDLISLEGCPLEVGGSFFCNNNDLRSLEGCPSYIGRNFFCYSNYLTSLEYGPSYVGRNFDCSGNPIHEIFKLFKGYGFNQPSDYKSFMKSLEWNFLRGTNIIKKYFEEACKEAGITCPDEIIGYNYI